MLFTMPNGRREAPELKITHLHRKSGNIPKLRFKEIEIVFTIPISLLRG